MEWSLLTANDLVTVLPWFADPETQRRLGGYYPVAKQLELVEQDESRHGWLAWEDGQAVGLCEVEVDAGGIGHVLILLAPAQRGQGKSLVLTNKLTTAARALNLRVLHAWIEPTAVASQACFLRAGYVPTGVSEDGFDLFALTITPA